jgi:hypothetical protein
MTSTPTISTLASPSSYHGIDPLTRHCLIGIGTLSVLSLVLTASLLAFLTYRLVFWRKFRMFSTVHQYILLIYNLILGDLIEAVGGVFSLYWLARDEIVSKSRPCNVQAWTFTIGTNATAFWVLAIALHTYFAVIHSRILSFARFCLVLAAIWIIIIFLAVIGPFTHSDDFYVNTGVWVSPQAVHKSSSLIPVFQCWINGKYPTERIVITYAWCFLSELGCTLIYVTIFIVLRYRLRTVAMPMPLVRSYEVNTSTSQPVNTVIRVQTKKIHRRLSRATFYMLLYPLIYMIISLPLIVCRLASMTGHNLGITSFTVAGAFTASVGWMDVVLYTFTRRTILSSSQKDEHIVVGKSISLGPSCPDDTLPDETMQYK